MARNGYSVKTAINGNTLTVRSSMALLNYLKNYNKMDGNTSVHAVERRNLHYSQKRIPTMKIK